MHLQQQPQGVTPSLSLPTPPSEWEKPKPFYTPMTTLTTSQPLGTCNTEMWVHRFREQERKSLEKRTTEGPIFQPTKPKTGTPSAPSPSVTFVSALPYIPETLEGASSNPFPQLMIPDPELEPSNIFATMLQDLA